MCIPICDTIWRSSSGATAASRNVFRGFRENVILQARVEVGVLQFLNTRGDPDNKHHIVRMRDFFMHRSHLCLVFELLSVNLYELVKHNQFRGLSMNLLRFFILQVTVWGAL